MHTIRIILWTLVFILALIIVFIPRTSAEAEPIIQDIKTYSVERVLEEFGSGQWYYFNQIIYRESKWIHTAQNKNSTAFGYAQFLDSTWKTVDCEKTDDKYKQIDCAITYIKERYSTPKNALAFHQRHNWY